MSPVRIPVDRKPVEPVDKDKKTRKRKYGIGTPLEEIADKLSIPQIHLLRELAFNRYRESGIEAYDNVFNILGEILDRLEDKW